MKFLIICIFFNFTLSGAFAQKPGSRGFVNANSIEQPIEYKVDKTVSYLNELSKSKKNSKLIFDELIAFFTDSGYFILEKSEKVELWVPVTMILDKVTTQKKIIYRFKEARIVHFENFSQNLDGKFVGKATVYDGVTAFDSNHQPIATKISNLTIPFDKKPLSNDYWQIYELKIAELKK